MPMIAPCLLLTWSTAVALLLLAAGRPVKSWHVLNSKYRELASFPFSECGPTAVLSRRSRNHNLRAGFEQE